MDLYNGMGGPNWIYQDYWDQLERNVSDPCLPYFDNFGGSVICDMQGHVVFLNLPSNGLTGSIPQSLQGLSRLTYLGLSGNSIEGNIPEVFGNMTQLRTLDLSNNMLSGDLPLQTLPYTPLLFLWLNHNQLNSTMPLELQNLHVQPVFKVALTPV